MATSMSPTAITFNDGTTQTTAGASGVVVMNVYTGSSTWTKPATVKSIKVTVVGGGGNGGPSGSSGNNIVGSGGGGGGTAIRTYPAPSLPGPQPFTVGGVAGTSSFGVAPITVISATGGASNGGAGSGSNGGVGSNGLINIGGGGGGGPAKADLSYGGSGAGGSSTHGGGGAGVVGVIGGNPGRDYGGGGSGGGKTGSPGGPTAGGSGTSGVVIVEEFY